MIAVDELCEVCRDPDNGPAHEVEEDGPDGKVTVSMLCRSCADWSMDWHMLSPEEQAEFTHLLEDEPWRDPAASLLQERLVEPRVVEP